MPKRAFLWVCGSSDRCESVVLGHIDLDPREEGTQTAVLPMLRSVLAQTVSAVLSLFLGLQMVHGQWVHFQDRTAERLVTDLAIDSQEKDCVAGDFNRDGWDDVVVVRKKPFKTQGGEADLLLLNVSGVLTDQTALYAPEFLTTWTDARDVLATDIDRDGWLDLIVANTFGMQPVCYHNRGRDEDGDWLGFVDESATRLPTVDIPDLQFCAVAAADITGDGAPEVYFSNYVRAPDIAFDVLWVNDGNGHFTDASDARLGDMRQSAFGTSVEIKDMDNDGDLDIIKTSSLNPVPPWNDIGVFILYNDGSGKFTSFQPVPTESPYMFTVADLNNDDRLDLYIVNDSQDFVVLNGGLDPDSAEPFLQLEKIVLQDSPRTTFLGGNLQCVDLDDDGDLDALVADVDIDIGICETAPEDPRRFTLLRNEGLASGTLVDAFGLEVNPWNTNVFDLGILDLNRDGKHDLFLAACAGYLVFLQEHTLHISSETLLFDGAIAGTPEEMNLKVCNNGPEAIDIAEISSTDVHFSADVGSFSLAPYACWDIRVTFSPTVPGDYLGDLRIEGDLSRDVALEGSAFTSPSAGIQLQSIEGALPEGAPASVVQSFFLSNEGGSGLQFEIMLRVAEDEPDRVLLTGDPLARTLIADVLSSLPNDHAVVELEEISPALIEDYETVVLSLINGDVSAECMEGLTNAVLSGKRLVILGGTSDPDFLEGLSSGLLTHSGEPGWKMPASPTLQLADSSHPLADELPASHEFNLSSASWYRIHPSDPNAWVAAINGDGVPCLLNKPVGDGLLVCFTNWQLSAVWDNPIDRPVLETLVANMVGSASTSWLSVGTRRGMVAGGEEAAIDIAFNAFDQAPGRYRAELIITSNDSAEPEIVLPVTFDIVPEHDPLPVLEFERVGDRSVRLLLLGEPGVVYGLERSFDQRDWEKMREVPVDDGAMIITEDVEPRLPRVFFRAVRVD